MTTITEQLDAARKEWAELGETVIETDLTFGDGEPVRVFVRKRGHRYDIDDRGRAVEKAGVADWRSTAERTVDEYSLNINRAGVVFVGAVEGGLDLAWLARRIAETSLAVYGELLDLEN